MSMTEQDRYTRHIMNEREAAYLYRGLATLSRGRRREVFTELADIEERHADYWAALMVEKGLSTPEATEFTPSTRARRLLEVARRYSPDLVIPVIEEDEMAGAATYADEPDAPEMMVHEEEDHARVLEELLREGPQDHGGLSPMAEHWHRADKSGTLRAAIFGVNDGLISNTALVMGFAGASAGRSAVLLAGFAGLLAGAFSMGAGEYISMANQREAFEREIAIEREEIRLRPEDEQRELELIYMAKGLPEEDARKIAARVMQDEQTALDTMVREELGLDPDDLGSPLRAAGSSFVAFSLGAVLVVLPYLFTMGTTALTIALALFVVALVALGAGMARLNGRPIAASVLRQVVIGLLAAGTTYVLGSLLSVSLT